MLNAKPAINRKTEFHRLQAAPSPFNGVVQSRRSRSLLRHKLLNKVCRVLHGRDVLSACFVDSDVELFLEAHHNLNL